MQKRGVSKKFYKKIKVFVDDLNISLDAYPNIKIYVWSGYTYDELKVLAQMEPKINLVLDKSSSLVLTGDSYVKSLVNADSTNSNINLNGYRLYVDGTLFNK